MTSQSSHPAERPRSAARPGRRPRSFQKYVAFCDLVPAGDNRDRLFAQAHAATSDGTALIGDHQSEYVCDWYGSPGQRANMRAAALASFIADHNAAPQRYLAGGLPGLPARTDWFDLALCPHLLFTWATDVDESSHQASLVGLCRIATGVGVFPLVLRGCAEPVEFLPRPRAPLEDESGIVSDSRHRRL